LKFSDGVQQASQPLFTIWSSTRKPMEEFVQISPVKGLFDWQHNWNI